MKVRKLWKAILVFALIFALMVPISAAERITAAPTGETVTEVSHNDSFSTETTVDIRSPGEEFTFGTESTTIPASNGVEPNSVSVSKDLSLALGKSWSYSFNTAVLLSEDHNEFNVIVSNVSGKYKVLVSSTGGFSYESSEHSDKGVTVTIHNASSAYTYTVYVVNTGASLLTCNAKISSYYGS